MNHYAHPLGFSLKKRALVSALAGLLVCAASAADLSLQNLLVTAGQSVRHDVNGMIQTGPPVVVQSGGELQITAGVRLTLGEGFHAQLNSRVFLRAGLQHFDSDGDGMNDLWEQQYGFNLGNPADAAQDADSDGLSNLQEFRLKTNPHQARAGDPSGTQTNLKIFVPYK